MLNLPHTHTFYFLPPPLEFFYGSAADSKVNVSDMLNVHESIPGTVHLERLYSSCMSVF